MAKWMPVVAAAGGLTAALLVGTASAQPFQPGTGGRQLATQAAKFLGAGAVATAVHYATLAALLATGLLAPVPASCAGYAVAAVLNYGLRRRLVFRSREAHRRTVPRYLAVLGVGFGLNAAVVALGVDLLGLPVAPVQVVATGLVLAWNFTAHRLWTFRASPRPAAPPPVSGPPPAVHRGRDACSGTGLPTRS